MAWFRVDDKLHDHPKIRKLRTHKMAALGLWTACGSWSADTLSDGFVPCEIVQRFDPDEGLAKRLVEVGLWFPTEVDGEDGYLFHQWTDHQPTKAEVERRRDEARERMRKRRAGGSTEDPATLETGSQDVRANTSRTSDEVRHPDPTRPLVPNGTSETRSRASRLPDDFTVTEAMKAWARQNTPLVGQSETDQFIDYWRSESGAKARKLDWTKAWQVWMRREQKNAERRPGLRSVPAPLSSDPVTGFDELLERADAREAARLIGGSWADPAKPPSDPTPQLQWVRERRREFIAANADRIRAALTERKTG